MDLFELIQEFRLFLNACRDYDRRWQAQASATRPKSVGLVQVAGRMAAYDLMSRFLDAAERRERMRPVIAREHALERARREREGIE